MKVLELNPKPQNKIEFHFNKLKFIPAEFGCYILTNFLGDILYIGLTNSLKVRYKQHLDTPKKVALTELGVAYYFFYLIINDEHKLNKLERGWMNHFELLEGKLPILNSIHPPLR